MFYFFRAKTLSSSIVFPKNVRNTYAIKFYTIIKKQKKNLKSRFL